MTESEWMLKIIDAKGALRRALAEALCWVPDGSGRSAEKRGAKCATVDEMRKMAREALEL